MAASERPAPIRYHSLLRTLVGQVVTLRKFNGVSVRAIVPRAAICLRTRKIYERGRMSRDTNPVCVFGMAAPTDALVRQLSELLTCSLGVHQPQRGEGSERPPTAHLTLHWGAHVNRNDSFLSLYIYKLDTFFRIRVATDDTILRA